MAKQNVSFVDRHIEKLLMGLAGLFLLIIVLMLRWYPNRVELSGESVGPARFYQRIRDQAETARNKMRTAVWDPPQEDAESIVPKNATAQVPTEFPFVFVPPNSRVPEVESIQMRGKLKLAKILPPGKPVGIPGRAFFQLPEPALVRLVPQVSEEQEPAILITQDHHWVTVAAGFSRKAQREVFAKADYELDNQVLMVAAIEAERQERLSNGQWASGEIIMGYAKEILTGPSIVEILKDDEGVYEVSQESWDYIKKYRAELESIDQQEQIVRPLFQDLLSEENDLWWQVPDELPGYEDEIDWRDYQAVRPASEDEDADTSGRRRTDRKQSTDQDDDDPGSKAANPRVRAKDDLKAAKQAYEDEDYKKAQLLLEAVLANDQALEKDHSDAQSLMRDLTPKLDLLRGEEDRRQAQDTGKRLGEDNEPIWLTDTLAEPGKTYRYRLRLVAFNLYAGVTGKLENPQTDLGRVLIEGEWSEWSDAVQVWPDKYLFFMGVRDDNEAARIEIHQLVNGVWKRGGADVQVGQPLAFKTGRNLFSYDAVVVAIDRDDDYEERTWNKRTKKVNYRVKPSNVLRLVNAQGEVEERIALVDQVAKKKIIAQIREEEDKVKKQRVEGLRRSKP